MNQNNIIDRVELVATKIITEDFPEKLVFHNIDHIHKIISASKKIIADMNLDNDQRETILIGAWFHCIGLKNLEKFKGKSDVMKFFEFCSDESILIAKEKLSQFNYPQDKIEKVVDLIKDSGPTNVPKTIEGKVLADAITVDLGSKKNKKTFETRYQELLLLGVMNVNKENFYDRVQEYLQQHEYHTPFGKKELKPKKLELIEFVEKKKKELKKQQTLALKKELNISEDELKKLKKNLRSVSGRDERGIQTMFRTTSRNHYTLMQMVDRKANILISLNAILLSLIVSRIIGMHNSICIHNAPIIIMLLASSISIIFAVLAIIPAQNHGEFSEQEIRSKEGNLLYFGNYHNMSFRDFNWGFLQMMNDSDYLYTSMIRDLYFLGQTLNHKNVNIRRALSAFIAGILITVLVFVFVANLPDFHFGAVNH